MTSYRGTSSASLAYGVLLVGVWRAISEAEFGRAVADERSRVAQDIHDGLAQYLFAISTHVTMLESGAALETTLPKLKQAAVAAQQEARYAVLALSSASGTAPFDAALRRYVEVLTADGALDVELEIDGAVRLAPDEQIEVFRIVQEGLANARRHADARRAWVRIGWRAGRRVVSVRDDGVGFEVETGRRGSGPEEHAPPRGSDRRWLHPPFVCRRGNRDRDRPPRRLSRRAGRTSARALGIPPDVDRAPCGARSVAGL